MDWDRLSPAERAAHFASMESRINAVLDSLGSRLPDGDRECTREYLDAGEYGLALEQVTDGLGEEDIAISDEERAELLNLARVMDSDRAVRASAYCPRLVG